MPSLTDNELRAVAYYSIGVSSEGGDVAYSLSYAGRTIHENDGSVRLEPAGGSNSGYSIGTLQTDFGAHPSDANALVESFQSWAKTNHPDWALSVQQQAQFSADLGRDGNHIRDPNFDADRHTYHKKENIPANIMPKDGLDIDQTFKARLNDYLVTDAGKSFIHQRDTTQVDKLMNLVAQPLKEADFYQKSTPEDQAKIFAVVAKAYNQGDAHGKDILKDIREEKINSLDDISKKIDTFSGDYMKTGHRDALSGAETFNAMRDASQNNPMHDPWQAVVANPLVNPTELRADPNQPHLPDQYAAVRGSFVDPAQGRNFVSALEKGESHNYGDPSKSNSRGFYAEGKDFVQWDRNGQGRAFVRGEWSELSRNDITLSHNKDHTLDVNITRDGQTRSLLHVLHPSGHMQIQSAAHLGHGVGVLKQGMHNEQVQKLQRQLGELGYLDDKVTPNGKFGPATARAVEAFQVDHHLAKGSVGPLTQSALLAGIRPLMQNSVDALPAVPATPSLPTYSPGLDDPRNTLNPNHGLYEKLQQRIPDASEARLLQFTAACHASKITGDNLSTIHLDEGNMKIGFHGSSFLSTPATVDLSTPPPQPHQAIQQIQQHDQQQAQMTGQIQAQNGQINQQAAQGPMPGIPGR